MKKSSDENSQPTKFKVVHVPSVQEQQSTYEDLSSKSRSSLRVGLDSIENEKYTGIVNCFGLFPAIAEGELFGNAVLIECIGTCALIFIGCGSALMWGNGQPKNMDLQVAFTFGLSIAAIIHVIGPISGGLINPAVTVGYLVAGKITFAKAIIFIVYQFVGAVLGAVSLACIAPSNAIKSHAATTVDKDLSIWQALFVEFFVTFLLTITMLAVANHIRVRKGYPAIIVGFLVICCHLFAFRLTGCSMNPARSLGSSIFSSQWCNNWIYFLGPFLGGIIAGCCFDFVFSKMRRATLVSASQISGINESFISNELNLEKTEVHEQIEICKQTHQPGNTSV